MGWESFGMLILDLGPLLQGQTRIAKLTSAYTLLIISRRALAREGDYEMMPVCACVSACVRACVLLLRYNRLPCGT